MMNRFRRSKALPQPFLFINPGLAFRADAVAEQGIRMVLNIGFDLGPVPFIIPNLLAIAAYRNNPSYNFV